MKKTPGTPRPTMKQVAQLAGCSQPTVSVVLNGLVKPKRISVETEQSVLSAAERLGYQLPRVRNVNRPARTQTVGLIIPTLVFSYWPEVVAGAESFLASQGYRILLSHTGFDPAKELADLAHFQDFKIDIRKFINVETSLARLDLSQPFK